MKLSTTLTNANIPAQSHKEISPSHKTVTADSTLWHSLTKRFWSYTEETSQTDTKPFEGLL